MNEETFVKRKLKTTEDYVNFWFHEMGVNVIPFDTKNRQSILPKEEHSKHFEYLMTLTEFNKFKESGYYSNGFIIKLGLVERGKYKGKYLNALDLDNKLAIEEFCAGSSLPELASEMIIEQKPGDNDRCHVLWLSNQPVKSLGQVKVKDSPDFAVKTKGPGFVSNSPNKSGSNYEFIEGCTLDPSANDNMEGHINKICQKYNIPYLDPQGQQGQQTFKEKEKWHVGERDNMLFEWATNILTKMDEQVDEEEFLHLLISQNKKRCVVPLDEQQVKKICKSAYNFKKGVTTENDEIKAKYLIFKEERERKIQEENSKDDIAHLIDRFHFKKLGKEIYYYNSETGNFVPGGQILSENLFATDLRKAGRKNISAEVNEKVKTIGYIIDNINSESFNSLKEWLGTKNCMINIKTGETKSFAPEFMNTTSLPVIYDPLQKFEGSKIQQFLYKIMPAKDVEISLNFIAYCLWREYKFANFVLLNGEGNNGKGTFIKLIQAFLGSDNYSAESLNRLLGNRFATSSLFTKLANFDADLKVNAFMKNGTDIIKVLTGNDEIMGEAKFMNDFKFTNYAKIIMACNKIPITDDRTIAFGKRMIIINFSKIFY